MEYKMSLENFYRQYEYNNEEPILNPVPPNIVAAMDQLHAYYRDELKNSISIIPQDTTDIAQVHAAEFVESKIHDVSDNGEFQKKYKDAVDAKWYGRGVI